MDLHRWKINTVNSDLNKSNLETSIYFSDLIQVPKEQFLVEVKENMRTTSDTHFQVINLHFVINLLDLKFLNTIIVGCSFN